MPIAVGLRNPGPDYAGTRHNSGAEIVAILAARLEARFKRARLGIRAEVAEVQTGSGRSVLALTRTFMNESGQAVAPLLRYYRITPDQLLVVHDDIDVPLGRIRIQSGRGSGGHNGVESVVKSLGTQDFWRLKFGVGRPPGSMDPADYVLRSFTARERPEVDVLLEHAATALGTYLKDGPEPARQLAGELTADEPP